MEQHPIAIGPIEVLARAIVGFLLGTIVGIACTGLAITFVVMFAIGLGLGFGFGDYHIADSGPVIPSEWWPFLLLLPARITGIASAVWFVRRSPRLPARKPRVTQRAARPRQAMAHGWTDFVFRLALGLCCGVLAAMTVQIALLVWSVPPANGLPFVQLVPFGMLAGFVWFACDFPWFAPRRATQPAT